MRAKPLRSAYDGHRFSLPAVAHVGELSFAQPVTFLVGENGSGKSTLIEALQPELGSHRPSASWFLRAESFYLLAANVGVGGDVRVPAGR